jgi:hypothetical protein
MKEEELRQLHGEDLHSLHCLPNFNETIRTRCMRWTVQVPCTGKQTTYTAVIKKPQRVKPFRRYR